MASAIQAANLYTDWQAAPNLVGFKLALLVLLRREGADGADRLRGRRAEALSSCLNLRAELCAGVLGWLAKVGIAQYKTGAPKPVLQI